MKTSRLLFPVLSAISVILAGCGTPPGSSVYVDPNGERTIVNVGKINIQDFAMASNKMVQSLLNSGVLEKAPHQPAVLAISRISNDTDQQFDTDLLTKNIRVSLLNTGKIVTTTTFGPGGDVEDPLAKSAADMNAFTAGQQAPTHVPDYTLTGKILVDKTSAGSIKQSSYIFQLTLTDVRNGNGVWEGEQIVTKQGQGSSVGW